MAPELLNGSSSLVSEKVCASLCIPRSSSDAIVCWFILLKTWDLSFKMSCSLGRCFLLWHCVVGTSYWRWTICRFALWSYYWWLLNLISYCFSTSMNLDFLFWPLTWNTNQVVSWAIHCGHQCRNLVTWSGDQWWRDAGQQNHQRDQASLRLQTSCGQWQQKFLPKDKTQHSHIPNPKFINNFRLFVSSQLSIFFWLALNSLWNLLPTIVNVI